MNAERLAELAVDLGFDGWLVCSLLNFPMLKNLQHVISITFWMCVKILLN
jgi:hypothetical protein